jgi:ABC-type amino acid transport system permease subunit
MEHTMKDIHKQNVVSLVAGMICLVIPAAFFFAVFMEDIMHNSYLMNTVWDKPSVPVTVMLVIGMPIIAAAINILPLLNISFRKEESKIKGNFELDFKIMNLFMAVTSLFALAVVIAGVIIK